MPTTAYPLSPATIQRPHRAAGQLVRPIDIFYGVPFR